MLDWKTKVDDAGRLFFSAELAGVEVFIVLPSTECSHQYQIQTLIADCHLTEEKLFHELSAARQAAEDAAHHWVRQKTRQSAPRCRANRAA